MKNAYSYDPCPQTRLTELASAGYALFWTLLLLLPVHLFSTNPAFNYLPHFGPEWRWGLGSLIVGVWQSVAALYRRPFWRWLGLALGVGLWAGVATCLAQGSQWKHGLPINTGCGVYAWTVVVDFISMLRLFPYVLADLSMSWGRWQRNRQRMKKSGD